MYKLLGLALAGTALSGCMAMVTPDGDVTAAMVLPPAEVYSYYESRPYYVYDSAYYSPVIIGTSHRRYHRPAPAPRPHVRPVRYAHSHGPRVSGRPGGKPEQVIRRTAHPKAAGKAPRHSAKPGKPNKEGQAGHATRPTPGGGHASTPGGGHAPTQHGRR